MRVYQWEALPHGMTEVMGGFLYLGSARDAEDEAQLTEYALLQVDASGEGH